MAISCIYCKGPVDNVVGMDHWHRGCREEYLGDMYLSGFGWFIVITIVFLVILALMILAVMST